MSSDVPAPDEVADDLAIRRVVAALAQAQDDRDAERYRSCLAEEVGSADTVAGTGELVPVAADALVAAALDRLATFDVTQHHLSEPVVTVDGDVASCEVDVRAVHHVVEGGTVASTWTVGGRYSLGLRRHGDRWLVHERSLERRYETGPAPAWAGGKEGSGGRDL